MCKVLWTWKQLKRITKESYQTDGFCSKGNNVHHYLQLLFVWQKLEKLMNSHFSFSICSFHLKWSFRLHLILFLSLSINSCKNITFVIPQINYLHHLQEAAKLYNVLLLAFLFVKPIYPASLRKRNNKKI